MDFSRTPPNLLSLSSPIVVTFALLKLAHGVLPFLKGLGLDDSNGEFESLSFFFLGNNQAYLKWVSRISYGYLKWVFGIIGC